MIDIISLEHAPDATPGERHSDTTSPAALVLKSLMCDHSDYDGTSAPDDTQRSPEPLSAEVAGTLAPRPRNAGATEPSDQIGGGAHSRDDSGPKKFSNGENSHEIPDGSGGSGGGNHDGEPPFGGEPGDGEGDDDDEENDYIKDRRAERERRRAAAERARPSASRVVTVLAEPSGESEIDRGQVLQSLRAAAVGVRFGLGIYDAVQRSVELDERGLAYVNMNTSGRLWLPPEQTGLVATSSIDTCISAAGFARGRDGSTSQFVNHYDSVSVQQHAVMQDSDLVGDQLVDFVLQGDLGGPAEVLVAYPKHLVMNPQRALRRQIEVIEQTALRCGGGARIIFVPYRMGVGKLLAAGRTEQSEGIFWEGAPVNFDRYFET